MNARNLLLPVFLYCFPAAGYTASVDDGYILLIPAVCHCYPIREKEIERV